MPDSKRKTGNHEKKRGGGEPDGEVAFKVDDRRHWARQDEDDGQSASDGEEVSTQPTILDEYKHRMEAAESKLQEYIAAFKQNQAEQEAVRARLARDVERKVDLRFGGLVAALLETVDDLDLALSHVQEVPEAESLARGVAMARDRFLGTLEKQGVERIVPDGEEFDPNVAEAVRVDPVDAPEQDGKVLETVRPGYRMGDHVIRAARVSVGRLKT
jgi:molecular chaperone GrpE